MKSIARAFRCAALAAGLLAIVCSSAWSWGPAGHTLITQDAIQLLPSKLLPFYEANSRYIIAFCMLPDDWRVTHKETAPQHYIDLEELGQPPFADLIVDRKTAEKRFGKEKLTKAGLVPWIIAERYHKLVEAFKARDPEQIVVQSAVLSHFVGDSHVPFHATKFYDGKTEAEKGIHARWESNMIELRLKPESIRPSAPCKIDDILKSAFSWCIDSYSSVDEICKADDKARERDPGMSYTYYNILYADTGAIARQRITSAAEDLAGVYVAAWEEAGRPELADKPAAIYWGQ